MTLIKSQQTPSPEEIVRHVAEYSTPVEREKVKHSTGGSSSTSSINTTGGAVLNFTLKAGKYFISVGEWDGMEFTFSD